MVSTNYPLTAVSKGESMLREVLHLTRDPVPWVRPALQRVRLRDHLFGDLGDRAAKDHGAEAAVRRPLECTSAAGDRGR